MTDYTLCLRHDCPSRDKCWRYRTEPTPNDGWQSYFTPDPAGDKCEYFIPKEER